MSLLAGEQGVSWLIYKTMSRWTSSWHILIIDDIWLNEDTDCCMYNDQMSLQWKMSWKKEKSMNYRNKDEMRVYAELILCLHYDYNQLT